MDERLIDLKNKVLDKALDKIFNMAQGYVDKVDEEDGCAVVNEVQPLNIEL